VNEFVAPPAAVIVVYGATGDLARRMVLPALYGMARCGLLPDRYRIVGSGRGQLTDAEFRDRVHDALVEFGPYPEDEPWRAFSARLAFAGGGFRANDPGELLDVLDFADRGLRIEGAAREVIPQLHYYAVPPTAFGALTEALGKHDLARRSRVIFEKPFGTDAASFVELQEQVGSVLDESRVFRLDHFLAKEAVRGLAAVRLANAPLARSWDRHSIAAVQIDVPETLDVADRGRFYDGTGAFLDMVVTHLFQVAALVAMEPPVSLAAADVARAREAAFAHFRPLSPDEVVLGQYDGYTEHSGVADGSHTDTFAAARLWIDNPRWRGVPFLLRSGKALGVRAQHVSLLFREPAGAPGTPGTVLTFSLAGTGELRLSLLAQQQGFNPHLGVADTEIGLAESLGGDGLAPYARLIHDALVGDQALFTQPAGLRRAWDVAAPVLRTRVAPEPYAPGSMGPFTADALASPYGWLLGEAMPAARTAAASLR
jgi:glucose-6-phosphate 1-dehydrogenase